MYETNAGDTWDEIARIVYGSEKYADYLMENNPSHLATSVFHAGVLLWIPELPDENDLQMPEWRD